MNNRTWHFYSLSDGKFVGRSFTGRLESDMRLNLPEECGAIEGVFDWRSQRVDMESGKIVDCPPPKPGDGYEWSQSARQWVMDAVAAERHARREAALSQIQSLESTQGRAIREAFLNPSDAAARSRVEAIDSQIAELRRQL